MENRPEMGENIDLFNRYVSLPEDIKILLKKAREKSSAVSREQFLAEVMTGKCPECGSSETKNCEKAEGIEDFTVGLCVRCGFLWCSECGKPLSKTLHCIHWDICRKCEISDESGYCGNDLLECKKLRDVPE
ncbi:MAG: hypothetical protein AB1552_07585 [Nitrospirota bacterium]